MRDAYTAADFTTTSALAYVEAVSALTRSRNTRRIPVTRFRAGLDELEKLWAAIEVHAVTSEVIRDATRAVTDHGLRAYDGVHLASALALVHVERVTFACWGRELRTAARASGLTLLPDRL